MSLKSKKAHSLDWLVERLESKPTYLRRKMFGCEAVYLEGRLVLVIAEGEEPWNGILLPTDREHHSAIMKKHRSLQPHRILGKWLYLSQADPYFEEEAPSIIERIEKGDPLLGIEPKPKRRKPKASRR